MTRSVGGEISVDVPMILFPMCLHRFRGRYGRRGLCGFDDLQRLTSSIIVIEELIIEETHHVVLLLCSIFLSIFLCSSFL